MSLCRKDFCHFEKRLKNLTMPKNAKGATQWAYLLQNIQKLERGILLRHLKNFRKKSHNAEKKLKEIDPYGLVRFCRLR